eukprot:33137_1
MLKPNLLHCLAATPPALYVPSIHNSVGHYPQIAPVTFKKKCISITDTVIQLPNLNTNHKNEPHMHAKRGRKPNSDPRSKKYKYKKVKKKKWCHTKIYSNELQRTNKKLKKNVETLTCQNRNQMDKIKALKQTAKTLALDLEVSILCDNIDVDEKDELIDLDWNAIETEEKETNAEDQYLMALRVLECSLESEISDRNISKHLKNQERLSRSKNKSYVWGTGTIFRYLKYKLPHIIGMVIALILIVYVGKECGFIWDDTTRKQGKFMASHVQCELLKRKKDENDIDLLDCGDNTDVLSVCIGYETAYNGAASGGIKCIDDNFLSVNGYIDNWFVWHKRKLIENAFPGRELEFAHVEDRIVIDQSDRFGANEIIHEHLQEICEQLDEEDELFSCIKHDLTNSLVKVQKYHIKLNHTEENELKDIPHPLSICTYMARLWKLCSLWPYNKAKYFQYFLTEFHGKQKPLINFWLCQLLFSKGMRELNLLQGLIFLLLLTPYFVGMTKYKWRSKSICTHTAIKQISKLNDKRIQSETYQANDFGIAKLIFCMESLVQVNGRTNNRLFMDFNGKLKGESVIFWNNLILILSTFMVSDISDVDLDCLSYQKVVTICSPLWEQIQSECAHIISVQTWMMYYLFTLQFNEILQLIISIKIILRIVYDYLLNDCNWKYKIMKQNKGSEHIRNNNDRVEKTHSVSSHLISRVGTLISKQLLKVKTLGKDNKIMQILMALFEGTSAQQQLLYFILQEADRINVAASIRNFKKQEKIDETLSRSYFQEHFRKKGRRRKRKTKNTDKKKDKPEVQSGCKKGNAKGRKKGNTKGRKNKRNLSEIINTETEDNCTEIDNGDTSAFECTFVSSEKTDMQQKRPKRRRKNINYNVSDNDEYNLIDSLQ